MGSPQSIPAGELVILAGVGPVLTTSSSTRSGIEQSTVKTVWPITEPSCAVIVVVPQLTALAVPVTGSIVAISGELEAQFENLVTSVVVVENCPKAANWVVCAISAIVGLLGNSDGF